MASVKPIFGTPLNPTHPLSKGLVGCWLFNEMSGNKAYDSSGQQNTGTITGMADPSTIISGWGPGPHGGAALLDGDTFANCGSKSSTNITGYFTLSCWLMLTSLPVGTVYPSAINRSADYLGYSIAWIPGGGITVLTGVGVNIWAFSKSFMPTINIWYNYVAVWDGGYLRLYVNGVEALPATAETRPPRDTAARNVIIGRHYSRTDYFNGAMSNAMIWNRAISAAEISYLYASPYAMFDPYSVFDPSQSNTIITSGRLPL